MEDRQQEGKSAEEQGQVQTYKEVGPPKQPHTEAGVHTGVGVETHTKGVAPHSEEGVHYLRCKETWTQTEERSNLFSQTFLCH